MLSGEEQGPVVWDVAEDKDEITQKKKVLRTFWMVGDETNKKEILGKAVTGKLSEI